MPRLLPALCLGLVCALPLPTLAEPLRTQLPVTLGAGLDHPLSLTAVRAGASIYTGDAELLALELQGEQPLRKLMLGELPAMLGLQGSALAADVDRGAGSDTLLGLRGGAKLTLPIPQVRGLWTGAALQAQYLRAEDDSETDVFAVLSTRYQASAGELGRAADFYASLPFGAEGPADTGLLLGAATALAGGRVLGAEIATENDQLTGYFGLPLTGGMRLTLSLGVADNVDLLAQAQLRVAIN